MSHDMPTSNPGAFSCISPFRISSFSSSPIPKIVLYYHKSFLLKADMKGPFTQMLHPLKAFYLAGLTLCLCTNCSGGITYNTCVSVQSC